MSSEPQGYTQCGSLAVGPDGLCWKCGEEADTQAERARQDRRENGR